MLKLPCHWNNRVTFGLLLKFLLFNCEINLISTWSAKYNIPNSTSAGALTITDTILHVWVVTLSPKDNTKLLQQLKSGFKRTINLNKYHPKVLTETQKQCLYYLIVPSFYVQRWTRQNRAREIISCKCGNKKFKCYNWWSKNVFDQREKKLHRNRLKHPTNCHGSTQMIAFLIIHTSKKFISWLQ